MVKYTVYRVSVRSIEVMSHVTLCRKNGEVLCYIVASQGVYYVNWSTGETQNLSPKCGLLIGCHAVEIDTTTKCMVVRIPRNSGFKIVGG